MIDFACKEFSIEEVVKCSLGLTKAEYAVLDYLLRSPPTLRTAEELSEALGFDTTTVQRGVKKLHEAGVIDRRQHNLDRGGYVYVYRIAEKRRVQDIIVDILQRWVVRAEEHIRAW